MKESEKELRSIEFGQEDSIKLKEPILFIVGLDFNKSIKDAVEIGFPNAYFKNTLIEVPKINDLKPLDFRAILIDCSISSSTSISNFINDYNKKSLSQRATYFVGLIDENKVNSYNNWKEIGFTDMIVKPFDYNDLLRILL